LTIDIEKAKKELQPDGFDGAITVAATALGVVPIAGSTLASLLMAAVGSGLGRRRDRFIILLAEQLNILFTEQKTRLDAKELFEDEQFVTVVAQATDIAVRNHQKEKIDALRNATINTALPSELPDDEQLLFVSWIDDLTALHIRILTFSQNPRNWMDANELKPRSVRDQLFIDPDAVISRLAVDPDLYDQIIRDLIARGLIQNDPIHQINSMSSNDRLDFSYLTEMGKRMLNFLSQPVVG
jgi:hypothetical protein